MKRILIIGNAGAGKTTFAHKLASVSYDNMNKIAPTSKCREEDFQCWSEAYANKKNSKSLGILEKLGLSIIGENKNGISYHLRGTYADLMRWYNHDYK